MTHHEENEKEPSIILMRAQKLTQDIQPVRLFGFAASQAWIYITLFNKGLITFNIEQASLHSSFYEASLFFLVVTLIVSGFLARRLEDNYRFIASSWTPGILCTLGTILLPIPLTDPLASTIAFSVAALTTGVGSGLFLVWWGSAYGATGGPTAAAEASLAFALASLVQPVLVFCPTPVRALTAVAIILASSACLMIQAKHTAQVDAETEEAAREERAWEESVRNHFDMLASDIRLEESQYTTPKEEPIPELPLHKSLRSRFTEDLDAFFFRLLLSSLIIGICTSVLQGFVEPADIATYDVAYAMSICFSSLAASALVFLTLLLSKRLDFAFSYQPVLPLAILGCSAILFLQESSIITLTLLLINYQYFTLINWVILASYSYNASMSAAHIFGWGRASLSGGILLGHLILFYTGNIGDYSFTEMTAVSFSIILVLSLTCSFLYTSRTLAQTLRRQWLSLPPRKSSLDHSLDNEIELTFEEKVDLTAQKYNITGRMYEVFVLLANGRSGTRIEQELYMAKGTVKTHTSRIYKKLDVHSKQQLLDLIETACKE